MQNAVRSVSKQAAGTQALLLLLLFVSLSRLLLVFKLVSSWSEQGLSKEYAEVTKNSNQSLVLLFTFVSFMYVDSDGSGVTQLFPLISALFFLFSYILSLNLIIHARLFLYLFIFCT